MLLLFSAGCLAQALPIVLDGQFSDWELATTHNDPANDATGLDLLQLQLANDANHLFLKITAAQEFELTDNSKLVIAIDTDNNPLTGNQENGLGVELYLFPGVREAVFYGGGFPTFPLLSESGWIHLPTVSNERFEIALRRNAMPDGTNALLPGPSIALAMWVEGTNADHLPNVGNSITYTFDSTPLPAYDPISLVRESAQQLRIMTWNTLENGLDDLTRQASFRRIIGAVQPDIVTFNECWDLNAPMVATFMNSAVPLGGNSSWHTVKLDQGNITASRYPIIQSWEVRPGSRLTASLIDLPNNFDKDLMVVNGHLRCCDADDTRQLEADAFAAFVADAKNPGGVVDLPHGTPFVLSGDLNLVGWRQQLQTLLTGDIVNTNLYGPGGPPDWDGTNLADALPLHTHQPVAFTWQSEFSSYPPSRIDYIIFANSAMELNKSFVVSTEEMPMDVLSNFGMQITDSGNASDHFPVVADFTLPMASPTVEAGPRATLTASPNPFKNRLQLSATDGAEHLEVSVFDAGGAVVWKREVSDVAVVNTQGWPAGLYYLRVTSGQMLQNIKLVKID